MGYLFYRLVIIGLFLGLFPPSSATCSRYYSSHYDDIPTTYQRSIVKPLSLFLINPTSKRQQVWRHKHEALLAKLTQPWHFNYLMEGVDQAGSSYSQRHSYTLVEQHYLATFFFKPLIKRLQEIGGETYKKKGFLKALFWGIPSTRLYNDFVQSLLLTNEKDQSFNAYVIPLFFDFLKSRPGPQILFETSQRLHQAERSDRSLAWLGYRGYGTLIQEWKAPLALRFKALRIYQDKSPHNPKIFSKYRYCCSSFFEDELCDENTKLLSALEFVDDYEFLQPSEQKQVVDFIDETNFSQFDCSFQIDLVAYFALYATGDVLKRKRHSMMSSLLRQEEQGELTLQRKIDLAKKLLCEQSHEHGEAAYEFLLSILSNGNLMEQHEGVALIIAQNLDDSPYIDENSESFQNVIFLLSKLQANRMGLSYSFDPYAIYVALKEKRQEKPIHRPTAYEGVIFLPHMLMRSPEIPIFPNVTHQEFCTLVDDLLQDSLTHSDIFTILGGTPQLRSDIADQKIHLYFSKHFSSLEKSKKTPITLDPVTIHLALALGKIKAFSTVTEADGFSPQTRAMMQFMINVLTCSGGKSVGITHSSHLLCEGNDLQLYDEDKIESGLQIKRFRTLLEQHLLLRILSIFNGESLFVRYLTGTDVDKSVDEPPHQTIYLKNLLAPSLPFLHFKGQGGQLKFDINAGCVSDKLIEKTHQDVLDAFYREISPMFVAKGVQAFVNEHYENPVVAAGVAASGLMSKGKYVDFEDANYRPVINLKGIFALLMDYGYFGKTDIISALNYNNLVMSLKAENL